MGKQKMIAGCLVLKEAAAKEPARYKVVLCELPASPEAEEGTDTYVVWYLDPKDKPLGARFFKDRAAAQTEFRRRTWAITHGGGH